jgi:N-acetyl-1-D-myo-inositol-2-amino-2-deoxy-alpha-D-glucopyranoside deacetylase
MAGRLLSPMSSEDGGLMLVHAHPDDEVISTGGVIARSVAEGRRVDLVTCTGGEEGEIHDPDLDEADAKPRLAEIRRAELDCSINALGGGAILLHLLGYRDSGMMGESSNEAPEAFWQADLGAATGRLVRLVREARPAVIVSYDSNGNYGHPDHINAHRITVAAVAAAADASQYPDAGPAHEVAKLYEVAFAREPWMALMAEMRERGITLPWDFGDSERPAEELNPSNAEAIRQVSEEVAEGETPDDFGTPEALITARVDVSAFSEQKRAAMACHRTQRQDMGWLLDLPEDLAVRAMAAEHYVLREWRGHSVDGRRETSLFDGL